MAKRDYEAEMRAIEAKGNLSSADYKALYELENERNAKIDSLNQSGTNTFYNPDGSSYSAEKTYKYQPTYSGQYANTDLSAKLQGMMNSGSTDWNTLTKLNNERVDKANGTPWLKDNAYDSVYNQVQEYIKRGQQGDPDALYSKMQGMFGRDNRPEFVDPYADLVKQANAKYFGMNYEDFLKSGQYNALADQYRNLGSSAMRDVIGQVSARTGGLASSYATSAAAQSYNNYMGKLSDAALSMYGQERDNALSQARYAQSLSDSAYGRYLDGVNQADRDRAFDYGMYGDALNQGNRYEEILREDKRYADAKAQQDLENQRYDQKYADTMAQQNLENQRYDQQYADSRADTDRDYALDKAKTLASFGDFSGFKALGYSDNEIKNMETQYKLQQTASKKSSGTKKASAPTEMDYDGLFQAALDSGNPKSFLANNYKKYGFTSSSGLYDDFKNWSEGGEESYGDGIEDSKFGIILNYIKYHGENQSHTINGGADNMDSMLNAYWEDMTKEQQEQVNDMLKRYGYI